MEVATDYADYADYADEEDFVFMRCLLSQRTRRVSTLRVTTSV